MNPEDYTLTRYMLAHGPATRAELPGTNTPKPYHREAGARRFDPWGGNTRAIYYIEGEHGAETVLRMWIDKNPQVIDACTPRKLLTLVNDAGSQFKAISKGVVKEQYDDAEYRRSFGGNNSGGDQSDGPTAYQDAINADPDAI